MEDVKNKETYETPSLTVHGSIEAITQWGEGRGGGHHHHHGGGQPGGGLGEGVS